MKVVVMTTMSLCLSVGAGLHAQVGGSSRPPSIRPILIDIEFFGTEGVSASELAVRIESRATSNSALKRVFESYSSLFEKNRRYVPRVYRTLFARTVDSLRGEIRYYNPVRAAADTLKILEAYNDHGYHTAQVRWDVRFDTAANTAVLRYTIKEGPHFPVREVKFTGLDQVPEGVRRQIENLEFLKIGEPYLKDLLTAEQERAEKVLRDNGYPFASVRGSAQIPEVITRRPASDTGFYDAIRIPVYTDRRYRFGVTIYEPDTSGIGQPVSSNLILDQIEYNRGEWYSSELVEQTRANLYALGVFDYIRVDSAGTRGDTVDLVIRTQLRKQRDIQWAVELGAEKRLQGWRVNTGLNASFTKTNLFGRAERATVGGRVTWRPAEGGRIEWGLNGGFFIPSVLGLNRLSIGPTLSYDDVVEAQWEAAEGLNSGVLRYRRLRGGIDAAWRFPRYTFVGTSPLRLEIQYNTYSGVGGFIANAARQTVADAIARGAVECAFDNSDTTRIMALRQVVEQTMRESIYRLQVLQGDDRNLVTGKDAVALESFEALRRTYIAGLGAVRDTRNDYFSPTRGDFLNGALEFGITGALQGTFIKTELDYRLHLPSGLRSSWAFRGHSGVIFEFGRFPLTPSSSRFGAGGANSIRGWGVRDMLVTAPPVPAEISDPSVAACAVPILKSIDDESRRLQGGLAVIELSAEYRGWLFELPATSTINQQLNQLQIVGFIDAGNAFFRDYETDASLANVRSIVENLAVSVGSSLGYATPFGPIRVGFGYPVYDPVNREGEERLAWRRPFTIGDFTWHLAIGHAF